MINQLRRVKSRMGPLWWHGLLMFMVMRCGDFVNLYIGMFLVPEILAKESLGAVIPLTKLAALVGVPIGIIGQTGRKYTNVFLVKGDFGKIRRMLRDLGIASSVLSVLVVVAFLACWPLIEERLKVDDHARLIAMLIAATAVISCWLPVVSMVVQGLKGFYVITFSQLARPVVRLGVILATLVSLQVAGYLLANVLSMLCALVFLAIWLIRRFPKGEPSSCYRSHIPEMLRYTMPIALIVIVQGLQVALEPWIIRQRLPYVDSAGYYIAAMFGDIPRWVAPALLPFLFPLVSERFERGDSTRDLHLQTLGFALLIGGGISVGLFFCGEWLVTLRPAWSAYAAYANFMCPISVIATIDVLLTTHMTHENASRRFHYLRYYVPLLMGEVVLLYGAMGWSFFRAWLPSGLWEGVDALIHRDLTFIVGFMLAARVLLALCLACDVMWGRSNRRA